MSTTSPIRLSRVAPGAVLEIGDGIGSQVRVERGTAWVTQQGDETDFILGVGDTFTVDRDGLVLASPLGAEDVILRVTSAAQLPLVA